jgi:predicted transposase YdaD
MSDIMDQFRAEDRAEGRAEGRAESKLDTTIKNAYSIMTKLNLSAEQALYAVDVSEADMPKYMELLQKKISANES